MLPQDDMTDEMKSLASRLEDTTQAFYDLALIVYNLEDTTPSDTIPESLDTLIRDLKSLPDISRKVNNLIPQDVLEYIEQGRNPDVYARQFSELVQKDNQYVNGKLYAIEGFQKAFAEEIKQAYPEVSSVVDKILNEGKVESTVS
ncbi:hypothetical protein POMI540_0889 [Schizosaccharomyces pombe]